MITAIERIVVEHYNESRTEKMTTDELHQRRRFRKIVFLRQVAFYLCCERYNHEKDSLETIGSFYELDHATVLHAKKTVGNLIDVDKKIYRDIEELIRRIDKTTNGQTITEQDRTQSERKAWQRVTIRLMKKRRPAPLTVQEVYNEYNLI